jgi:hypothetical protein
MDYAGQISFALLLAIPIACLVWTFTQEEVFKEVREALKRYQQRHRYSLWRQKLAYMPTCHYCFSHYVAALFVVLFRFRMLADDWRGYLASLFTLVLIANVYMTVYNLLRVWLRRSRALADRAEARLARAAAAALDQSAPPPVNGARPRVAPHTRRNGKGVYVEA